MKSIDQDQKIIAIEGGTPVRSAAFPAWPQFGNQEIEAAAAVLRSGKVNYWTGGEGRAFESEFAAFTGCQYAVAVANGSVALDLALLALGISPGDEVIVTSRSFVASASCIALCGATPVFADVDRDSQNITAETVKAVLSPRTRAIVAVHLAGWPCDMDPLNALAEEHNLAVIEDCAQAHGACYKGRPVGSLGDIAAFSFCQDKIMSTGGEGGMVTTNNHALWKKVWSFKDHGKSFDLMHGSHSSSSFRWVHEGIGTNYRMTEMQSAMGRVLLARLKDSVAARRVHAAQLSQEFAAIPGIRVTIPPASIFHSYYKYYAFVQPEKVSPEWSRDRIVDAVRAEGVPCFSGSCSEIYREKAFAHLSLAQPRLAAAQELGETSLMFLVHTSLTAADIADTCVALARVMQRATQSAPMWAVPQPVGQEAF